MIVMLIYLCHKRVDLIEHKGFKYNLYFYITSTFQNVSTDNVYK
jgi:hypothetical protein